MTPDGEKVMYREAGAHWRTVYYGPVLCLIIVIVEVSTGQRAHWPALSICALLMAGVMWMIVSSGRTHIRVELTPTHLVNGTETIDIAEINQVFPESEDKWDEEPWENARVLGELANVPRGRTAIGLELERGILVRAWAKDDRMLRAGLEYLHDRSTGNAE